MRKAPQFERNLSCKVGIGRFGKGFREILSDFEGSGGWIMGIFV